MNEFFGSQFVYGSDPIFFGIMSIFMVWTLFWKGCALWHAVKANARWWFLLLLIMNTAGILEMIYLFGVLKIKGKHLIPQGK